jgi:hypothetical protein
VSGVVIAPATSAGWEGQNVMRREGEELDGHSRNGLSVGAVEVGRFLRRMCTLHNNQSPMPNRTTARPPMADPAIRPVEGGLDLLTGTVGDVVVAWDAANGDDDVPDVEVVVISVDARLVDVNNEVVALVDACVEVGDEGGIIIEAVVVCCIVVFWVEVVVVPGDDGEFDVESPGTTFMKSMKNWVPESIA